MYDDIVTLAMLPVRKKWLTHNSSAILLGNHRQKPIL
jgi:hypothetical protein